MNTCKRFSPSFSDFVENDMLSEQRLALEEHLSVCSGCQTTVARLQNLRDTLNQLTQVQAAPDFEAILRARIRREGKRAATPVFALRSMMPRLAMAALAGTLIFVSASFLLRQNSGNAPVAAVFSIDQPLQSPFYRTVSPAIPLTAPIFYTLDKFSPKQWPANRKGKFSASDSLSVDPRDLPRGPQNSRASLFSL